MLKITDIQPQKHDPSRLNVYLNGEFAFGIARVVAPWLKVGQEISTETMAELIEKDQREKAYQRALNYLSYRVRSEEEVRRNLRKHEVPDQVIEDTLDKLRDKALVDDQHFAEQWVENRSAFHPRGKRALAAELRQKGLARQTIDQALEDVDEHQMAQKVVDKKWNRVRDLDWPDFRKKLFGYLSRRGFHYGVCREVVQQAWDEREKTS